MMNPSQLENQIERMPIHALMDEVRKLNEYLKKKPKDFQARYALALMYLRTDSFIEAIRHLKKAHKINPKSESILKLICEVLLLSQKDYKNALSYLRKWSLMRRDLAVLWVYIAECLNHLEKPQDALEALDKAEAIDATEPKLRLTRADVYAKMGNEEGAQSEFEKSYSETGQIKAAAGLVALPNFKPSVDELRGLRDKVLLNEETAEEGKRSVLSDIGTAFEKLKAYEDAFECFSAANAVRVPFLKRDEQLATFKNIRETFTREYMLSKAGKGDPSDQPIFIVGMPRSGTTLTESILAGHPKIVDNGELPFFSSILNHNGVKQVRQELLASHQSGLKEFFDAVPDDWFKGVAREYLTQPSFGKNDKRHQVDKLPHNFMSVGLIHLTFPNAKIIHCRRHPVDGALSCYKAPFSDFHDYATDLSVLGSYYRGYWDLMDYWRDLLPGKMFEICYEDVVSDTENVAKALIDHIGLEWDEACLNHTQSKKSVRTASQWQVRQPIYTTSVAKWRNYEKQLQPMISSMGSIVGSYEQELTALAAAK